MAWGTCPICSERDELDRTKFMSHRCKPHWQVRQHGKFRNSDEWADIYARDAPSAAEKFAEEYDQSDGCYPLASGRGDLVVMVKDPKTERAQAYRAYGETLPSYSADRESDIRDRIEPREVRRVWKRKMERADAKT